MNTCWELESFINIYKQMLTKNPQHFLKFHSIRYSQRLNSICKIHKRSKGMRN